MRTGIQTGIRTGVRSRSPIAGGANGGGTFDSSPTTWGEGTTVVLTDTGQSFGTKSQAAPILFDTVDKVWMNGSLTTPYSALSDGTSIPVGSPYPWNNRRNITYSTSTTQYGNRTAHYYGVLAPSETGWNNADVSLRDPMRGYGHPNPVDEETFKYYVRWSSRWSFQPTSQSGSHKYNRIADTLDNTANCGSFPAPRQYLSWTQMHITHCGTPAIWIGSPMNVGAWNLQECYWDTLGDRNFIRLNSTSKYDGVCAGCGASPDGMMVRLLGMDSSVSVYWGETVELSDIWIDKTAQRIEIGDAASLLSCTVREPQVATAWADTSITFSVNQGALGSNFANKFLFVMGDGESLIASYNLSSY